MTHPQPAQPDTDQPAGTTSKPTRWRITNHYRPLPNTTVPGHWCRWSLVNVSEKLANGDDRHCPDDCSTSDIEVDPNPPHDI